MKTYIDSEATDLRVEIIPLIDVIFCILTFFILAAIGLTRLQGLNLDLPQAKTGKPQMGDTFEVTINALGELYVRQPFMDSAAAQTVEGQRVTEPQLYQAVASYMRVKPAGVIVLNADRLVSYDQVIRVLDVLQSVGGNRVALGTTSPSGESSVMPAPQQLPSSTQPLPTSPEQQPGPASPEAQPEAQPQ